MSRVITFSTMFPSYHTKKGMPTHFVGKIQSSLLLGIFSYQEIHGHRIPIYIGQTTPLKHHTIRRGKKWAAGDKFSPRIWSGKPYASKQITIAPDIEIKRVVDFEMNLNGVYSLNGKYIEKDKTYAALAKNDGLTEDDLFQWLMPNYEKPLEFSGQILIWNDINLPY